MSVRLCSSLSLALSLALSLSHARALSLSLSLSVCIQSEIARELLRTQEDEIDETLDTT